MEWKTRKELGPTSPGEQGYEVADDAWSFTCFAGKRKWVDDFDRPVSQGEAMVRWLQQGWSWTEAVDWWKQSASIADVSSAEPDVAAKKRIRQRLGEIARPA